MKKKIIEKLSDVIRFGINKAAWIELFSGEYTYPCEERCILDNIEGEDGVIEVEDYFLLHDKSFMNKHEHFKAIIDNEDFNPYKEYRLANYFVKTNTFSKLNVLFTFREDIFLKRNIIIVGEKGSGKTALQNCWIYENNDKLEENNIFWVRCDGHKLYQQWLGYLGKNVSQLVNLEEYLDIQLLYVFAKYCLSENRPFFFKIINELERDRPSFNLPVSRDVYHETVKTDLLNYIKSLREIIIKHEVGSKNPKSSYAYDRVMDYAYEKVLDISAKSKQLEKRKWIKCSEALQKFLRENGYWIFRIVDGVDNVHINDESSKDYYDHMMDNVFKFIRTRPVDNYIHLIAIRERTYIDIITHHPILQQTREYIKPCKVNSEIASFKEIILKRYDYALNNAYFDKGDLYDNIFVEVIKLSNTDNINKMYHNNVRAYLYNKMSLISSVYYRLKQLQFEGNRQFNIGSNVRILENRNRFLNGRLLLSTRKDFDKINNEVGLCSTNIFYFNSEIFTCQSLADWPGLCKTRILQLLIKYGRVFEKLTHEFIVNSFGYSNEMVNQSLNDLRAFGMIDSVFLNGKIMYVISDKGKYEFENIFSDIDTLYYYGLDSYLSKKLLKKDFIISHSNKFRSHRTNYPIAALKTSISFIVFLILKSENEIDKYNMIKNDIFEKYALIMEKEELQLPFKIRTILKRLISMFNNEERVEFQQLDLFLSDSKYFNRQNTL